jgi:hypothetical protein
MVPSRIKNPDLAAQINEGELAWLRYITPITEHYGRQIAQRDYRGKRLAALGPLNGISLQDSVIMLHGIQMTSILVLRGRNPLEVRRSKGGQYTSI